MKRIIVKEIETEVDSEAQLKELYDEALESLHTDGEILWMSVIRMIEQ